MADTPVSPTNVSALPTAPNRNTQTDPLTYSQTADAWAGALPTWTTQVNNIAANVNFNADSAFDSAAESLVAKNAAEAAETAALAAQAAAEAASNATEWVSGQAYLEGDVVWSPITYVSYRANTNTSGTTDPSLSADWTSLNVPLPVSVANGGTGLSTLGTAGQVLAVNSGATALEYAAPAGGITLGTAVATTSGTAIDFTGIPAGTKRITINFDGVSTNGTDHWLIQLGDAGGVENTGYVSTSCQLNGSSFTSSTAGFIIRAASAGYAARGTVTLTVVDAAAFTWAGMCLITVAANDGFLFGGSKSLSAELTSVRITTTGGTNTFDAGKINITTE